MQRVIHGASRDDDTAVLLVVVVPISAVLTAVLPVTWLARIGVLIVLVEIAPITLTCHATPYTDAMARLRWRSLLGLLGAVVLQAPVFSTTMNAFLSPDANLPALDTPDDVDLFNLNIVACLSWLVVKIPGLMGPYVTHSAQSNMAARTHDGPEPAGHPGGLPARPVPQGTGRGARRDRDAGPPRHAATTSASPWPTRTRANYPARPNSPATPNPNSTNTTSTTSMPTPRDARLVADARERAAFTLRTPPPNDQTQH